MTLQYTRGTSARMGRLQRWALPGGAALLAFAALGLWLAYRMTDSAYRWNYSDAAVYFDAARRLPGGEALLYSEPYGRSGLPFTYPPFSALVFRTATGLGWDGFRLLLTALSLLALVAAVYGAVGAAQPVAAWSRQRRAGLVLAITAACLWLTPVFMTLQFGQVNLILLALVMWDCTRPPGAQLRGVGVGLAAGVNLTAVLFIVYLLLTRRYRAAATATITAATTVLAGLLVLPRASLHYWLGISDASREVTGHGLIAMTSPTNQSLNAMMLRTLGETPASHMLWTGAAALTAAVGLACALAVQRRGQNLLAVVLCGATTTLISPLSWAHQWVWVVPALVLLVAGMTTTGRSPRSRRLCGATAVLVWWMFAAWPAARNGPPPELIARGLIWLEPHPGPLGRLWEALHENAYVLLGILALLVTAAWAITQRHDADIPPQTDSPRDTGPAEITTAAGARPPAT